LRVDAVLGGQRIDRVAGLRHDDDAVHRWDDDLLARRHDVVGEEAVAVRPADLGHGDVVLRGDAPQVLAGGDGIGHWLVVDRRRCRDRHRLDDRAVTAQGHVTVVTALTRHDRFRIHGAEPRGQAGGEMAIHRRVARHRYGYSEDHGMGQVTISSQNAYP